MVEKLNIEKLTTSSTEGNLSARISDDKIVEDAAERYIIHYILPTSGVSAYRCLMGTFVSPSSFNFFHFVGPIYIYMFLKKSICQ